MPPCPLPIIPFSKLEVGKENFEFFFPNQHKNEKKFWNFPGSLEIRSSLRAVLLWTPTSQLYTLRYGQCSGPHWDGMQLGRSWNSQCLTLPWGFLFAVPVCTIGLLLSLLVSRRCCIAAWPAIPPWPKAQQPHELKVSLHTNKAAQLGPRGGGLQSWHVIHLQALGAKISHSHFLFFFIWVFFFPFASSSTEGSSLHLPVFAKVGPFLQFLFFVFFSSCCFWYWAKFSTKAMQVYPPSHTELALLHPCAQPRDLALGLTVCPGFILKQNCLRQHWKTQKSHGGLV